MKRILAVILTIVMLLGVVMINTSANTVQDDTKKPIATLVTNDGSPLDIGGNITQDGSEFIFTLRFDYFIPIKGIDVTIDAGEGTIYDVETWNLPTAVYGDTEFDENYDYKRDKHAVRFVDINITSRSRIVCYVKSPNATQFVTATGKYADTGETLFRITTQPQQYEILEENNPINVSTNTTLSQSAAKEGYFIPYGAVFTTQDDKTTFATKNEVGSFEIKQTGSKYLQFKLPKKVYGKNNQQIDNLTAFGVSTPEKDDAENQRRKFGSYSEYDDFQEKNYSNGKQTENEHGTLIFEGDWLSLKHYYIKQGNTVQQFVKAIYKQFDELGIGSNKPDDLPNSYNHIVYNVPNREDPDTMETIRVYKFPREKYIWRDGDGKLEYAIRLHYMQRGETYTSVAYCDNKEDGLVHISYNVKSVTVPESPAQ